MDLVVVVIEVCGVGTWKGAGENGLVAVCSATSQETRLGGTIKRSQYAVLSGEINEQVAILVCSMSS